MQIPHTMQLAQVVFIHRHGQRTPLYQPYSQQLYPNLWRDCHLTPYLHAFYQSLEPHVLGEKEHSPDFPAHERPPHFSSIQLHPSPSDSKETNSASINTLESYRHLELAFQTRMQSPGTCFYGQLTDTGKRNMMSLGSRLRHLYIDKLNFLKDKMDQKELYVRSTDYSRTIESVQYLLGGLYPFSKRDPYHDMTIHIRRHEKETMYPHSNCPLLLVQTKALRQAYHQQTLSQAEIAFGKLSHLGLKDAVATNMRAVHRVYDFLACLEGHGISFPWNVKKESLLEFEDLAVKQWCNVYEKEDVARKAIGRFLPEIKEQMLKVVRGAQDGARLAIFSGHDSTISPLLSAFKVFSGEYPGFASNITFELFKESSLLSSTLSIFTQNQPKHYVRMLYNGFPVLIPACQEPGNHKKGNPHFCTLEAFFKRMDDMTPKDYELECQSNVNITADWDD